MTNFLENLNRILILCLIVSTIPSNSSKSSQNPNKNLPKCKYEEDVIKSDKLIPYLLQGDVIFTGKVASSVQNLNNKIVFDVILQKCFKNSGVLGNKSVVKVVKLLRDGEGLTCRQAVRKKLTAIFVGIVDNSFLGDVELSISPVPITLANLDRVSNASKGEIHCHLLISVFANILSVIFSIRHECVFRRNF